MVSGGSELVSGEATSGLVMVSGELVSDDYRVDEW